MLLSDVDIVRNLGKGITIHPLTKDTISGGHVRITASEHVYSLSPFVKYSELDSTLANDKAFLRLKCKRECKKGCEIEDKRKNSELCKECREECREECRDKWKEKRKGKKDDEKNDEMYKEIKIREHSQILIFSSEIICLGARFQGRCIPRVDLLMRGLQIDTTPIKPGSVGYLLINIKNPTDVSQCIEVGESIIVVEIDRLSSKANNVLTEGKNANVVKTKKMQDLLGEEGYALVSEYGNDKNITKAMKGDEDGGLYSTIIDKYNKLTWRKRIVNWMFHNKIPLLLILPVMGLIVVNHIIPAYTMLGNDIATGVLFVTAVGIMLSNKKKE
jgi:deoxycytidine triphosphate deaminase